MRVVTYFFFYTYVGLLILAGAWGVWFATVDTKFLFHMDVKVLEPRSAASVVSQYRFLRAVEFGFGMFAFLFRREIFQRRAFNRLFVGTMAFGVWARVLSLVLDGRPYAAFDFFAGYELVGLILILSYSRRTLEAS